MTVAEMQARMVVLKRIIDTTQDDVKYRQAADEYDALERAVYLRQRHSGGAG